MNFRDTIVKILAITGFLVTVAGIAWIGTKAIQYAPQAFSSLASMAEHVSEYKPLHELTLTLQKTVVNSGESFELLWTDVHQEGEFKFTYTCAEGIHINVRSADGSLMGMNCTDTLTVPATVHGLYLSIDSSKLRFTDVVLNVSFSNTNASETFENTTKITVVNAEVSIPEVAVEKKEDVAPVVVETPSVVTPQAPVVSTAPQTPGQNDLQMTILGSGVLTNGIFTYTARYDSNLNNALRFDVKNVGTKMSDTWYFNVVLPSGKVYTSPKQSALRPHDHIEFTLGFYLDDAQVEQATLTTMLYSDTDVNASNNTKSITVNVR